MSVNICANDASMYGIRAHATHPFECGPHLPREHDETPRVQLVMIQQIAAELDITALPPIDPVLLYHVGL